MHRSGTSALTNLLGLLGAARPRRVMPATPDNPQGYGESPAVVRFNNRLLESADTRWNQEDAIPGDWFTAPSREQDRAEALGLLKDEFPAAGTFVLKDPRMCRLLPFWRSVLDTAGIPYAAVLMIRDPREVARSLATRALSPGFRPAAIVAPDRSLLLWMRHVLDAERFSRGTVRHVIEYATFVEAWRAAVAPLFATGFLPPPSEAQATAADALLHRRSSGGRVGGEMRRMGEPPPSGLALADHLLDVLRMDSDLTHAGPAATICDALVEPLGRLVSAYRQLRTGQDPLATSDPYATAILQTLAATPVCLPASTRTRRAVFVSGSVASIGHVYRVKHAVEALRTSGWQVSWHPVGDPEALLLAGEADVVVVYRAPWDDALEALATVCRERRIPLIYDVDDLVFEPALMEDGSIAILDAMPPHDRRHFAATASGHQMTVRRSDGAILTTVPLATAAGRHVARTWVLPNSLSPEMEATAATVLARRGESAMQDGRPRLVFASGTPSHTRDFAVAAEGVARLFARRPEPMLVVIGDLDVSIYACLRPFADRIESRPIVPLLDLFAELVRCDVNLCPLELGNAFCEAKSAVRWLFAAAVGLPSVASPTQPLREVVISGHTGLLATEASDWELQLETLIDDPMLRQRLGDAARIHALASYGAVTYRDRVVRLFKALAAASGEGR